MMSSAAQNLRNAKSQLRAQMKIILNSIPAEEKLRQSEVVVNKLLENPMYCEAQRISLFLSMPDEIQTTKILEDALKSGKKCYIPRYFTGEDSRMEMVLLRDMEDYKNLPVTKWNIKQPSETESREEALDSGGLDLILMPGLAFTTDGKRLGRGRGYYDKYLNKCRNQNNIPATLALSFRQQLVHDIPVDENDFLIDKVIFDRSVIRKMKPMA